MHSKTNRRDRRVQDEIDQALGTQGSSEDKINEFEFYYQHGRDPFEGKFIGFLVNYFIKWINNQLRKKIGKVRGLNYVENL